MYMYMYMYIVLYTSNSSNIPQLITNSHKSVKYTRHNTRPYHWLNLQPYRIHCPTVSFRVQFTPFPTHISSCAVTDIVVHVHVRTYVVLTLCTSCSSHIVWYLSTCYISYTCAYWAGLSYCTCAWDYYWPRWRKPGNEEFSRCSLNSFSLRTQSVT